MSHSTRRAVAAPAVIKKEHVSDGELFSPSPTQPSKAKGKGRARLSSPIKVTSDDDIDDGSQMTTLVAADEEDTLRPVKKCIKTPVKPSVNRQ